MHTFQNKLASNIGDFLNLFLSYSPDFQMAFITTDDFHFVDGTYFTHNTLDLVQKTSDIVNSIGVRGSANEKGLKMLEDTLAHNSSWFRTGAHLVAIFLTDEGDNSPMAFSQYAASYDILYPQGMFLPFAIIGDIPNGCGGALPGWGYYEIINHYNSQWWSICDLDWGSQMEDIALSIVNSASFLLDHPSPKEETIRVFVNGQELLEGWYYNPSVNSISFNFDDMPESGDTVEVSYEIWECE
jgi:hypothetical protein